MLTKPIRFHLMQWRQVDWERLSIHLAAALFVAVGTALTTNQADPWPAVAAAVKLWAGASLIYMGGYLQNAEKKSEEKDAQGN